MCEFSTQGVYMYYISALSEPSKALTLLTHAKTKYQKGRTHTATQIFATENFSYFLVPCCHPFHLFRRYLLKQPL